MWKLIVEVVTLSASLHRQDSVRKLSLFFLCVFKKNELTHFQMNEGHQQIAKPSNSELLASHCDIIEVRVNHCVTSIHRVHNFRFCANGKIVIFRCLLLVYQVMAQSHLWRIYRQWKACLPGADNGLSFKAVWRGHRISMERNIGEDGYAHMFLWHLFSPHNTCVMWC